jgi:hypothetical protein
MYVTPSRKTETRHHPKGKTCHHFAYHGLTCDEYDALRERAAGRCEICGVAEEETRSGHLEVDHSQELGIHLVRGLLCHYCNNVVMCCLDGCKPWSEASRQWEAKAREYVTNSWHQVTPEALARAAEIAENRLRQDLRRANGNTISVPANRGVPAMADRLRKRLTPRQVAELARLLSGGPADVES